MENLEEALLYKFKGIINNGWVVLLHGILLLILGVIVIANPGASILSFGIYFALSFLLIDILESFFAISNAKTMQNWSWTLVHGIMTLFVGVILLNNIEISLLSLTF